MPYRDRGKIRASVVDIEEARDGSKWILRWDQGDPEDHASAAEALKAVRCRDRVMSDAGFSIITTVRWTAYTRIGLAAVRALQ